MRLLRLVTGPLAVGVIVLFLGLLAVRPVIGALFGLGVIVGIIVDMRIQ